MQALNHLRLVIKRSYKRSNGPNIVCVIGTVNTTHWCRYFHIRVILLYDPLAVAISWRLQKMRDSHFAESAGLALSRQGPVTCESQTAVIV